MITTPRQVPPSFAGNTWEDRAMVGHGGTGGGMPRGVAGLHIHSRRMLGCGMHRIKLQQSSSNAAMSPLLCSFVRMRPPSCRPDRPGAYEYLHGPGSIWPPGVNRSNSRFSNTRPGTSSAICVRFCSSMGQTFYCKGLNFRRQERSRHEIPSFPQNTYSSKPSMASFFEAFLS